MNYWTENDGWNIGNNIITYECDFIIQVPIGYDGVVLALYDAELNSTMNDDTHIYDVADENTLFFKLK